MLRIWAVAALLLIQSAPAFAQSFPTKPIRVILGFPGGSLVDVVARSMAGHMQKQLGQPLVFEARLGAGGYIAVNSVTKAEPDGYTIHYGLLTSLVPALVKNSIDAGKELTPISEIVSAPFVFYSSGKLPVKTMSDLISYSKANPRTLNFASPVAQIDIMMQLIGNSTGITYTSINYPGATAYIPAMITGEIGITINTLQQFMPHMESGTIRALFIATPRRMSQHPDVPTAREIGIANMDFATFDNGFWGPKGVSREIVAKLNQAAVSAVNTPEIAALFVKYGFVAIGSTPEEQLRRYEATRTFWTDTAKAIGFNPL